jgi:hypothetical protein
MDGSTIRFVVGILGVVCCLCLGGIIWLEVLGRDPPEQLGTIAGASLGALCALLVTQRPRIDPPGG